VKKPIKAINANANAVITEFEDFDFYIEMTHDKTIPNVNILAGFLLRKNAMVIRSTLRRLKEHMLS